MSAVVLIDDEQATIELVRRVASQHEVLVTDDVRQGLKLATRRSPVLIVLSADLPAGYAACRKLKKHERFGKIPLFLLSGTATAEQFEEHAKLPTAADAYFLKPLTQEAFESAAAPLLADAPAAPAVESPDTEVELAAIEDDPPADEAEPDLIDEVDDSAAQLTEVDSDAPEEPPALPPVDDDEAHLAASQAAQAGSTASADELDELRLENAELKLEITSHKRDAGLLTTEVTKLTERVHNLKMAHERMEQAFEIERGRFRTRIGELEQSASGNDGVVAGLKKELGRFRMLHADMLESLEVIHESLQVPIEIVERHRELERGGEPASAADDPDVDPTDDDDADSEPAERAPIALGGAPDSDD